jgi:hypothetical protein
VSSELERLLRDAREALPVPDEDAGLRVRRRVLATLPRGRARTRALVLIGATLVAAVVLGVTAGSLSAPSGVAAAEPASLGFVPEPGWFALQSPPPAVHGEQTVAVAANVPFASDDTVHGFVEPSGLPYSTLLRLPPRGVVLVATMAFPSVPLSKSDYPETKLPLRLRDDATYVQWGAQVRHDQALGQYQLRATVRGYDVDVVAYFGTSHVSSALLAQAQRQLDALVIRPQRGSSAPARALPSPAATQRVAVIDHTYSCKTALLGGTYELKSRAHPGSRSAAGWWKLPYAVFATGGWAGPIGARTSAPPNSLAWITAGAPSTQTTVDTDYQAFAVLGGGTLGVNKSLCRPLSGKPPLSNTGLRGGTAPNGSIALDCAAPRHLLLRLRATVDGSSALRERARVFLATNASTREATLVVRTPAGRLLAYADVSDSGRARLFTAKGCSPR